MERSIGDEPRLLAPGADGRRPPRRWPRRVLIATTALVVSAVLAAGGLYVYARYKFAQIKTVHLPGLQRRESASEPMNILLVGSNTRTGLDPSEAKAFGTAAEVGGARSDVTMILHLDPRANTASILSIPRDLFLPIPGTDRQQRVDAALNAGPERLVETVHDDLGIPIHHYVELNFDSFQRVVNTLGGIDMFFPTPVRDAFSGLNITHAGCQHLDGFQALAVVRARHLYYLDNGRWRYDGFGDLSRIRRNHEFLRVLALAVKRKGLGDPLTANAIVNNVVPQVHIDKGFSFNTMVDLIRHYHATDPNLVPQLTLPVTIAEGYHYRGVNYGDVVLPDQPSDQQVVDQFLGIATPPNADLDPGQIAVQFDDGSGSPREAQRVAAQLRGLGFNLVAVHTVASVARPAETTVLYGPGKLAAAQRLAASLSGAVAIGSSPTPPGVDVILVMGTSLTVAPPSTTTTTASIPAASQTSAATPVLHPVLARPRDTATTAPSRGASAGPSITVGPAPLAFDPTACS